MTKPFGFIEGNFLAGRTFSSWADLNQWAREWCDKVNSTYKKHIRAVPRELFAVERLHLKPLPAWIPEVSSRNVLDPTRSYTHNCTSPASSQ